MRHKAQVADGIAFRAIGVVEILVLCAVIERVDDIPAALAEQENEL